MEIKAGRGVIRAIGCWVILFWAVLVVGCPAALASIHHYPEGTDRVMVRSLQTLRDRSDRAWQLVMFNRLTAGKSKSLHLRLVGFPGVIELTHPHPLLITTGTEQVLSAADRLTGTEFAPNVGEYDLRDVMAQLDSNTPLRLALPIAPQPVELLVPPFVVQEWRQIAHVRPPN